MIPAQGHNQAWQAALFLHRFQQSRFFFIPPVIHTLFSEQTQKAEQMFDDRGFMLQPFGREREINLKIPEIGATDTTTG